MPSTWWNDRRAMTARAVAARAHRKAAASPRAPFAIAFAVSLVLLAAAVDFDPKTDEQVTEVEELSSAVVEESWFEYVTEPAEPELLESGLSMVEVDGYDWILGGAVVRNPHERALEGVGFAVARADGEAGVSRPVEVYFGSIPAGATVRVGFVLANGVSSTPLEQLRIETTGDAYLRPDPDAMDEEEAQYWAGEPVLPEVEQVGFAPLASPDGFRFELRVVKAEEYSVERWSVLFRDADGNLIGGLPGIADPFARELRWWSERLPEGESTQHVDVLAAWMPEGADPALTEVGASGAVQD